VDPLAKDLVQVSAWLVAAVGGTIAAWKAVAELKRANTERAEALKERREQFRWQQAEMAMTALDQLWSDGLARCAMKMLDWDGLSHECAGRKTGPLSHQAVVHALRVKNTQFTTDEGFVRDSFDQLFDGFERIEHLLAIGLVNWGDVKGRLDYYVGLLARCKGIVGPFLDTYGFELAARLLARFPAWTAPPRPVAKELSG
jgi:hypothetical protein